MRGSPPEHRAHPDEPLRRRVVQAEPDPRVELQIVREEPGEAGVHITRRGAVRALLGEAEAFEIDAKPVGEREAGREGRAEIGLKYGPSPRQTIDLFKPKGGGDGPLALFIHGGYWRSLEPSSFSQMARGMNARVVFDLEREVAKSSRVGRHVFRMRDAAGPKHVVEQQNAAAAQRFTTGKLPAD